MAVTWRKNNFLHYHKRNSMFTLVYHIFSYLVPNRFLFISVIGCILFPKKVSWSSNPVLVNMTLFENRAFADGFKFKNEHSGLGWPSKSMTGILISRGRYGCRDTALSRGKVSMWKMEAEIEVMQLQPRNTKDCPQPSLSWSLQREREHDLVDI